MMKKIFLILATIGILTFAGCSSKHDIIEYNDKIITIINTVDTSYKEYNKFAEDQDFDFEKFNEKREQTITTIKGSKEKLDDISAFDGDDSLINEAKVYIETNLSVLKHEEKDLLELWKKIDTEEESKLVTKERELLETINTKINEASDKFNETQEKFAKKFNYELK